MSTASRQYPPTEQADPIVRELQAHLYVTKIVSPREGHYNLTMGLNTEAIQVLVDYLGDSGFLRVSQGSEPSRQVSVQASQPDADRIRQEFQRAFRKVSQFMEYQELKKEYAQGQVPRHLSEWLMEGGF